MSTLVSSIGSVGMFIVAFFVIVTLISKSIIIVRQQNEVVVERLGKFNKILKPGLNFIIPFFDKSVANIALRIQQLDVSVETKTKDNVFVTIPVSIQFRVTDTQKCFYTLSNYEQQLNAYVFDCVRTILANLELDKAFAAKEEIATQLETTLKDSMENYGFNIINTLVTDINPDEKVRAAMNEINAAQRQREAAISLAEADKIKIVKQAEADAESKRLQGEGVANQRNAIVEGLVKQYKMMTDAGCEDNVQEILLMTQYFDTLSDVSKNSETKTLMIPSNPGGLGNALEELRNAMYLGVNMSLTKKEEDRK